MATGLDLVVPEVDSTTTSFDSVPVGLDWVPAEVDPTVAGLHLVCFLMGLLFLGSVAALRLPW